MGQEKRSPIFGQAVKLDLFERRTALCGGHAQWRGRGWRGSLSRLHGGEQCPQRSLASRSKDEASVHAIERFVTDQVPQLTPLVAREQRRARDLRVFMGRRLQPQTVTTVAEIARERGIVAAELTTTPRFPPAGSPCLSALRASGRTRVS